MCRRVKRPDGPQLLQVEAMRAADPLRAPPLRKDNEKGPEFPQRKTGHDRAWPSIGRPRGTVALHANPPWRDALRRVRLLFKNPRRTETKNLCP